MNDNELELHYLKKLLERLTIVFTHNIPNGKPLLDSDRDILYQLHKLFYDGCLEGMSSEALMADEVTQQNLFTTTQEAPILPFTETPTDSLS